MEKTEVLLENGKKARLELRNDHVKKFKKFIEVGDEIIIGLIKVPLGVPPIITFWLNGEYIGGTPVIKPQKPKTKSCGGGGGCSSGNCHGKGGGGGFHPGGAGHC